MSKAKKIKLDTSFSKNLLGLKFMQDLHEERVENDKNELLESSKQQHISYQFCERLRFGRFSFKGMNLEIESIMNHCNHPRHNNIPPNTPHSHGNPNRNPTSYHAH